MTAQLSDYDVGELKGVGPAVREKLERLGIETQQDLLFHLPLRYEDRSRVVPIAGATVGSSVQVLVQVQSSQITFGKRRSLVCRATDNTGSIELRFFYFSAAQKSRLAAGQWLLCYGEVSLGRSGKSIIHPELRFLSSPNNPPLDDRLTPVYPVTEGLKQHSIRKLIDQVLPRLSEASLAELIPGSLREKLGLGSLVDALLYVHRPPVGAQLAELAEGSHPAKQRLAIEELMAFQLSMLRIRQRTVREPAAPIAPSSVLQQKLREQLPFQLTHAQDRVLGEIASDLQQPHPMLRLVQGDVGSGKTLVAAMAALQVIESGYQVVLMAPTEILAEQHWNNFSQWFAELNIDCGYLVGKLGSRDRKYSLEQIETGQARMVIGTHALFQDGVNFHNLALVIVDEQHRFGVHQRLSLKEKGRNGAEVPHQLIMTATPIPRTLAMTAYADLSTSIIDELPPGRTPVTTVALPDSRRNDVVNRVAEACRSQNAQAYWVCTLIEESEELQAQAAEATAEQLALAMPDLAVGLVHGRLKPFDKQAIMESFKQGAINLLVATTVIEVGVDVPNASVMVIENPERLGLAQLHQLRGRVGRGSAESHCVLLYHPPLSNNGQARIDTMRQTNDGFRIAEKDLELRGPGEVLGTRQTGLLQFKIADVLRDKECIPKIQRTAEEMLKNYPQSVDAIIRRWLHYREVYSQV